MSRPESSIARAQGLLGLQTPDMAGLFRGRDTGALQTLDGLVSVSSAHLEGVRNTTAGTLTLGNRYNFCSCAGRSNIAYSASLYIVLNEHRCLFGISSVDESKS